MLLLIAFNGSSQTATQKDSVCFSIETAAKIMADLDRLAICIREAENLNAVVVPAMQEALMIQHMELEGAELEVEDLTAALNDSEAKVKRLKGKRIWWGVGGVAVGALAYSILAK